MNNSRNLRTKQHHGSEHDHAKSTSHVPKRLVKNSMVRFVLNVATTPRYMRQHAVLASDVMIVPDQNKSRMKDIHGELCHRQLCMLCFFRADDRCVAAKRNVTARVKHQIP